MLCLALLINDRHTTGDLEVDQSLCFPPPFIQVSLTHPLEVTWARIQIPLMVEMSSTLDLTNKGPRKPEILSAAVVYPKLF